MARTGMTADEIRARAISLTLARIRRHGFEKVRLSDVARDLGLSHAALYAHFTDKAALLDAATEQWLQELDTQLEAVCSEKQDPFQKIQNWFLQHYRLKRDRMARDPELYRAFDAAAARKHAFVAGHLAKIQRQIVRLVEEAAPRLGPGAPGQQAALLWEATAAFHHPRLMLETFEEDRELLLIQVLQTLLAGMAAGDSQLGPTIPA